MGGKNFMIEINPQCKCFTKETVGIECVWCGKDSEITKKNASN